MTYPPAIKVYRGFLLSLLLAGIFTKTQSLTTPQRCSDDGDYKQYWDEVEGTCKHCNKCNAGSGLNKPCGNGEGKGAYCVECPASYFSDDWNYDVCKKCRICENVESVYKECTAKQDRECGKCKDGFYKHIHGTCEPCEQEPERPECNGIPVTEPTMNITIPKPKRIPLIVNEQGTNEDQSGDSTGGLLVAAIVLPIIATILIIILLLIVIYMSRRKKKQPRANKGRQGRKDGRKRIGSDGGPNEAYQSTPEMQRHTSNTDPETTQLIRRSVEGNTDASTTEEIIQRSVKAPNSLGCEDNNTPLLTDSLCNVSHENELSTSDNMSSRDGVLTSPSDPSSQGQDGGVQEIFTVDVHEPPEVKQNVTDEIEQKREDAKKFAEGLSLSDDLPYHINHDISKRLKQNNDYLMLASYVGVNPVGVKAMDKPEEVLGYMSTSMEGKRDVARLIDELLKIPRYDIIDEVLVKWLFEEKEKRQSQMHENTDQK